MRRNSLLVALAAIACVGAGLAALPHFLPAQPSKADPNALKIGNGPPIQPAVAKNNSAALPVKKVVLFTSGVGYFQREGQVENDARIDLSFPTQDINDLLKSMVLNDLNGGKVSTVSYDSQDPLAKTLKSFAINLAGDPGFANILDQARGEKVSVAWIPAGGVNPQTISGTIVSVERKKQPMTKEVTALSEVEYVNILSDKGLHSIKLAEVAQVQFQSTALNAELNRALDVVAQGHDTQKKGVSLLFTGKGKRTVQVGYVVEHPIWKTSYRMVLSKEGKPFLQGWALVENPTNEDWNNVDLNLVSGRPVSFKMDLYQPLYVDRPMVALQLFQNLKPITYEGDMDSGKKMPPPPPGAFPSNDPKPKAADKEMEKKDAFGGPGGGGFFPPKDAKSLADAMKETMPSVAQGVKLGDQFQYQIKQPVSVARQKSALVPIITKEVEGTKVSIYNEASLPKYPMLGLKFKNTTGDHLMQGPITVFAEDSYAGDSLINDVQPGEERMLSYAVDLATEVKTEHQHKPDAVVKMTLSNGIIHKTITQRDTKTYTVKNRSDHEKLLILEHPIRAPEFVLVTPTKPAKTSSYYRFELMVPADATKSLEVVEEKKVYEEIVLNNSANDQTVAYLAKSTSLSPALKAALLKAIDLKTKWAKTQGEIANLQNKLKAIRDDQTYQVNNMKVIPQADPVYKKYLDKFLKQEEQIDAFKAQIEKLQTTAEQQRQTFEEYVLNLTVKEEKE